MIGRRLAASSAEIAGKEKQQLVRRVEVLTLAGNQVFQAPAKRRWSGVVAHFEYERAATRKRGISFEHGDRPSMIAKA
jgi:hypothetical protein